MANLLLLTCSNAVSFEGQILVGEVVHVSDGATLTIQEERQKIKIHLAGIIPPPLHTHYGVKARKALGDMVFGKTVRVVKIKSTESGTINGRVFMDGMDVSQKMLNSNYRVVPEHNYNSH